MKVTIEISTETYERLALLSFRNDTSIITEIENAIGYWLTPVEKIAISEGNNPDGIPRPEIKHPYTEIFGL